MYSDYFTKTGHGLTRQSGAHPVQGGSMDPGIFSGIASGVGSLIGQGINYFSQKETNYQNERLMREQWAREDNALQRQVADADAAGISRFAVSGGAGAGSLTQLSSPEVNTNTISSAIDSGYRAKLGELQLAQGAIQLEQQQANIEKTKAETASIELSSTYKTTENALLNYDLEDRKKFFQSAQDAWTNFYANLKKKDSLELRNLNLSAEKLQVLEDHKEDLISAMTQDIANSKSESELLGSELQKKKDYFVFDKTMEYLQSIFGTASMATDLAQDVMSFMPKVEDTVVTTQRGKQFSSTHSTKSSHY